MSTYTSEPGTRLAGRYRLVDQTAAGSGWTMWKAVDETLARSVSVLTFAPGFPRIPDVVTAARAASRLTDPRFAQVFDVEDGDQAFVVLEWVSGESLADLIAEGPLDPAPACSLVCEAARALAGAHAAGLAHLCLSPRSLRWTRSSGVKILGLGIDAALAGTGLANASDPSLTDTRDLSALLYAALTGYWPGETQTGLPPAPRSDGEVCTARQVSPEVPAPIDAVVTRALLQRPTRQGPPIVTPDAFADAISGVAPPVPLPEPAPPVSRGAFDPYDGGNRGGYGARRGSFQGAAYPNRGGGYPNQGDYGDQGGYASRGGYPPNAHDPAAWNAGGGAAGYQDGYQSARRGGTSRAAITVVVVLVLVAVAVGAWAIASNLGKSGSSGSNQAGAGSSGKGSASSSALGPTVLTPQGAKSFDILGNDPAPEDQYLLDPIKGSGQPWQTQTYDSANFANLKNGDGYLIEMGRTIKLTSLKVDFAASPGRAGICIGNQTTTTTSGRDMTTRCPEGFRPVAPQRTVSGETTFDFSGNNAVGEDILIWFTQMTSAGDESISSITVYGSAGASAG